MGDNSRVRCIRNFVAKDTLVVVTSTLDGERGDGMKVDMHVSLASAGNTQSEGLGLIALQTDQGCSWKRIREAKGCSWREQNGIYISRRFII